ncbi:aldo/keto reductase [Streptomyces sp. NPDC004539]|uniref:aldo/keto reductase n=1 Tax=Streptomyces sp. NPDC004539 TaxID=3154280 RepID=UPI0033B091B1
MRANEEIRTAANDTRRRADVRPPALDPVLAPVLAPVLDSGAPPGLLALQRTAGNAAVVAMLQRSTVRDVLRSPGRPLDDRTRTDMESRLGADFASVRIHDDRRAERSAAEVGARAYTSGDHVVIGRGGGDRHTLAHELTHVIQQRQGPVTGTDRGDGVRVSDPSDRFERAAEANARRVMSGAPAGRHADAHTEHAAHAHSEHPGHQASPMVARMPTSAQAAAQVKPWLVFGVDGRDKSQLDSAVAAGYRRFDTAQSYGNITTVAEALNGLPRGEYEILYKFDVDARETPDALRARLTTVAALFGNSLDALVIHNLDADRTTLTNAWNVLQDLKTAGTTAEIGLGNIGEDHVGLLDDLGGVDLVENSVSSVLLSETVAAAIKKSGAHLYYYDVIRTARDIGLDLTDPDNLNGLVYQMAGMFPKADHTSNSTMISSSGTAGTQAANLRDYGGGPDHADFTGDEQYDAMEKIDTWRKQQSSGQVNDTSFTLQPTLSTWLQGLCDGTTADTLRADIAKAAQQAGRSVDRTFIGEWLVSQGHVTADDLTLVKVPSRVGLKRRYISMPLQDALAALFGVKNCDWKWSIQLVQLMFSTADDWDSFLQFGADEIVV